MGDPSIKNDEIRYQQMKALQQKQAQNKPTSTKFKSMMVKAQNQDQQLQFKQKIKGTEIRQSVFAKLKEKSAGMPLQEQGNIAGAFKQLYGPKEGLKKFNQFMKSSGKTPSGTIKNKVFSSQKEPVIMTRQFKLGPKLKRNVLKEKISDFKEAKSNVEQKIKDYAEGKITEDDLAASMKEIEQMEVDLLGEYAAEFGNDGPELFLNDMTEMGVETDMKGPILEHMDRLDLFNPVEQKSKGITQLASPKPSPSNEIDYSKITRKDFLNAIEKLKGPRQELILKIQQANENNQPLDAATLADVKAVHAMDLEIGAAYLQKYGAEGPRMMISDYQAAGIEAPQDIKDFVQAQIEAGEIPRQAPNDIIASTGYNGDDLIAHTGASPDTLANIEAMKAMSMEMLNLQIAVQNESRSFQSLSNVIKTYHDAAMTSVRNSKA